MFMWASVIHLFIHHIPAKPVACNTNVGLKFLNNFSSICSFHYLGRDDRASDNSYKVRCIGPFLIPKSCSVLLFTKLNNTHVLFYS